MRRCVIYWNLDQSCKKFLKEGTSWKIEGFRGWNLQKNYVDPTLETAIPTEHNNMANHLSPSRNILNLLDAAWNGNTAQKVKFPIKDFFSKCDQIRRKLRIWPHLLKKSSMEHFLVFAVKYVDLYIQFLEFSKLKSFVTCLYWEHCNFCIL